MENQSIIIKYESKDTDNINTLPTTSRRFDLNSAELEQLLSNTKEEIVTKPRSRLKTHQSEYLIRYFQSCTNPKVEERNRIANQLQMKPQAVQVWFQNRRAKLKRERQRSHSNHSPATPVLFNSNSNSSGNISMSYNPALYSYNPNTPSIPVAICNSYNVNYDSDIYEMNYNHQHSNNNNNNNCNYNYYYQLHQNGIQQQQHALFYDDYNFDILTNLNSLT